MTMLQLKKSMKGKDYKEFPKITFWREDDEIVAFKYAPKLNIDLTVAKELVQNRLEYCNNVPSYSLIDFTNVKSVTKEARDYMNDPKGGLRGILGGAFLSNSAVSTLFINLYLKINKPTVPAKFFTDKNAALEWLKRLKSENEILAKP
jgi:hypothetical protein